MIVPEGSNAQIHLIFVFFVFFISCFWATSLTSSSVFVYFSNAPSANTVSSVRCKASSSAKLEIETLSIPPIGAQNCILGVLP